MDYEISPVLCLATRPLSKEEVITLKATLKPVISFENLLKYFGYLVYSEIKKKSKQVLPRNAQRNMSAHMSCVLNKLQSKPLFHAVGLFTATHRKEVKTWAAVALLDGQ